MSQCPMDLFGANGDENEEVDPLTPPPNRAATGFHSEPDVFLGGHGIHPRGGSRELQGLDLNSQAQNFPDFRSYSNLLSSPDFPTNTELHITDGRQVAGPPRSTNGGHGCVETRTGSSANVATPAAKPFRTPRVASGGTRGGRGTTMATAPSGPADLPCFGTDGGASGGPPRFSTGVQGASGISVPVEEEGPGEDDEQGFRDGSSDTETTDEEDEILELAQEQLQVMQQYGAISGIFGTYYHDTFMNKAQMREDKMSGYDWVMTTLNNPTACFNMFRMSRQLFDRLHELLVSSYGLTSSNRMSSIEALAMFLWIIGAPQSMSQAENRFQRSKETVSRKFREVLHSLYKLSGDVIKPKDPEFRTVHPRLQGARFSPLFDNCIGAIDGTHIPVVVPASKLLQHMGRYGYTTQNVLAICDFDMRFTFAVAGWPGSVHDMRVFNDAIRKYGDKFPHPPPGKFYLVDSGYPNRAGYLAPYRGTKYHLPEFRQGPRPSGKKELFNFVHSSLRNVIERSFGVLKMKWRILLDIPAYPLPTQSKIILSCMALHNFIRDNAMEDADFEMCEHDENYMPIPVASSRNCSGANNPLGEEDQDMNVFRDQLADALYGMRS